uniref:Ring finger domain/Zinc finger, C3HC4 type (RING finger) containing protein, putative n=1 Tax=Theileria annulata TaxID=5874 RepID=A0A3B0MR32_THEAN
MESLNENNLGSSLEVRNRIFGGVIEYFICLKKFRDADVATRQAPSDPLMELVLLSPRRSLIFIRFSILFSIFISVILLVPDLIISKFDHFSSNVLRFAFTVVLYYYTFPPNHETRKYKYKSIILPKVIYKNATGLKSECCGICLDDFTDEDVLRILQCYHGFHVKCIDLWLCRSLVCPLCMKTII